MKKLILLALTAAMVAGCTETSEAYIIDGREVVVIDSCEYIRNLQYGGSRSYAHKGNCKFCAERRKQELKELVELLKEK